MICVFCCYKFKLLIAFFYIILYLFIYFIYLFFYSFMILLLFYEMKLLVFIGEFFTPMLPLLLFFYPHSPILCSSVLLSFFFI
ncbi:hypothetical protein PPACK8108_LOCUS20864, partial [Phakopsora pachyrhizi]